MSDMLEHGASGGAAPLPPKDCHDDFLELCATATTGSLDAAQRRRLKDHLSRCEPCREIMAQYEAVIGKVIPFLAPDPIEERGTLSDWSLETAEAQLFRRLNESDRVPDRTDCGGQMKPLTSFPPPQEPSHWGEALWGHMWGQFAAGLLLIATLGLIAYRIGVRRGLDVATHAAIPVQSVSAPDLAVPVQASPPDPGPAKEAREAERQLDALRSRVEEGQTEIGRLKAQLAQAGKDLGLGKADRDQLARERTALSGQLESAQRDLESYREKLDAALSQGAAAGVHAAALEQRVNQLTESALESDQEAARERELLDRDRDIRELMGARDLYIAEVFDVAKTGDTQKPFGRVFYTSGKSLIFYAYDLDQQPGIERASTFQAWGRRGPDRQQAVSLGILYQDSANKKRWILKADNRKTLAQIDAVFVTVEPNGGSSHPSGKPLLFAYLRIQPNHP